MRVDHSEPRIKFESGKWSMMESRDQGEQREQRAESRGVKIKRERESHRRVLTEAIELNELNELRELRAESQARVKSRVIKRAESRES
jgi:hypothetical protein